MHDALSIDVGRHDPCGSQCGESDSVFHPDPEPRTRCRDLGPAIVLGPSCVGHRRDELYRRRNLLFPRIRILSGGTKERRNEGSKEWIIQVRSADSARGGDRWFSRKTCIISVENAELEIHCSTSWNERDSTASFAR